MAQAIRAERPRKITYDEFLRWDGENQHVEWVDGDIIEMSPVSEEHDRVDGFLFTVLRTFVEQGQLGRVLRDPFQMKTGPRF